MLLYAKIDVQYSVNKKTLMLSIIKQKTNPNTCVGTRVYTEIAHAEVHTVMATVLSQPK